MHAITAVINGQIRLRDLPAAAIADLRSRLRVSNPELIRCRMTGDDPDPSIPHQISLLREHADSSATAPRGAIRIIRQVLRQHQLRLQIEDRRSFGSPLPLRQIRELRDYQQEGAEQLLMRGQGLVVLPCGGGKTMLALGAISMIGRTSLVIVPTKDLVDQWTANAEKRLGIRPSILGAGKHHIGPFTVATTDALRYHAWGIRLDRFGVLVIDEAHHVPTELFQTLISEIPAAWRLGLTATPDRADGMGPLVELSFGQRLMERSVPELVRDGWLILPEVIGIPTAFHHDLPAIQERHLRDYDRMTKAIIRDEQRAEQVARLIHQQSEPTMVLANSRPYCQQLARRAEQLGTSSIQVLTSKHSRGLRQRSLDRMRQGELQIIIATSLADEGLDIRNLAVGILALPESSKNGTRQRAGRLMRPYGHKQSRLYDIVDREVPNLLNRWQSRCTAYRSLGITPRMEEPLLDNTYGTSAAS